MEQGDISHALNRMADWQSTHEVQDNNRHAENVGRFDLIGHALTDIKDNHLRHIQDSSAKMEEELAIQRNDTMWIKWLLMGLVSGVGFIVVGVMVDYISHLLIH